MTSNVLPLFWNLASSSKDTRLTASVDLVASLQEFQGAYLVSKPADEEEEGEEDEDDDEDEEDAESGIEVDGSDDEEGENERDAALKSAAAKLDSKLASENAEDVVYTVKRLVRGLASSREQSRLGFAVALTELLERIPTISATQVISLLVRSAPISRGMKGVEERDMLFARLFGLTVIVDSGILFTTGPTADSKRLAAPQSDFDETLDRLIELGQAKAWLRESAWWTVISALRKLLASEVAWKDQAVRGVLARLAAEQVWTQEKVAAVLLLQSKSQDLDWKAVMQPTFKNLTLLAPQNLSTLAKILKESDASDDETGVATSSTGSWKPQLHFVWDLISDAYFVDAPLPSQAPFQDFYRAVVDESLFSNTSSSQRRYWGFQVFQRALPRMSDALLPQLFTPNFMRCWTNNLSSADRYLYKAAVNTAKLVQDVVKQNPNVGFALISRLTGKHGRMDFDRATKTKTVEGILSSLTPEGVEQYMTYLQNLIVSPEEQSGSNAKTLDDRRQWAIDQLYGLCRNGSVPKQDSWIASVLDFLLVHGFFSLRKADKKSNIAALHSVPKPALSDASCASCRARFMSCLVEVTTASPQNRDANAADQPSRQQGCDSAGRLWTTRILETVRISEANEKHLEPILDADEEIRSIRDAAEGVMKTLRKAPGDQAEVAKGVEILLGFLILQTYDESEDALEMLEDVTAAARDMFKSSGGSRSKGKKAPASEEATPPIDQMLDTLVALLDKGSSDLRSLANLVMGMIAPAFTSSTIEHLVAQLKQTVADAAEAEDDDEEEEEDEDEDMEDRLAAENGGDDDDDAAAKADKAALEDGDADDDEDDDAAEDDDESINGDFDEDEDDNAPVDPAFRQRMVDALKAAGLNVEEDEEDDDEEAGGDGESSDEEEVWDDEQMLKVDEHLAAVFKQRAGKTKRTDMKNMQLEQQHFKSRILDLVDTFARKQAANPLVLDLILPLLQLVQSSGTSEQDLVNKASVIIRSRFGKARDAPVTTDTVQPTEVLKEIHNLARKAPTTEFSQLCSICSVFVCRGLEASHPTSTIAADAYRQTMEDFLSRKQSSVHAPFILDFIVRFPVRAWALREDLCKHLVPGEGANVYRQVQGYAMLQSLVQQMPNIAKVQPRDEVVAFIHAVSKTLNATLVVAALPTGADWKADRLKDMLKFALVLARVSKKILAAEGTVQAWDIDGLKAASEQFNAGERTGKMKATQGLITQVLSVLAVSGNNKAKNGKKNGNKAVATTAPATDAMEVDGQEVPAASSTSAIEVMPKPNGVKKSDKKDGAKKRKSVDGTDTGKVKKSKAASGSDKQVKKVKPAAA